MSSQLDFRWRYQPKNNSQRAILLNYIQEHPAMNKSELIITAISAYYLPLAYQTRGNKKKEQLEKIALEAIFSLLRQIDKLCLELNLDRNKFVSSLPTDSLISTEQPNEEIEIEEDISCFNTFFFKAEY